MINMELQSLNDLTNTKVGDKVFICYGGWSRHIEVALVEKVGVLHLTVRGEKYRKGSGRRAGDHSYSAAHISTYNDVEWQEYREEVRERNARHALQHFDWQTCERTLVFAIYALLPRKTEANKP